MDHSNLLNRSFSCECGKEHEVPIKLFKYSPSVFDRLNEILDEAFASSEVQSIAVVADQRTWQVCGEQAKASLGPRALPDPVILEDRQGKTPVCDDVAVTLLKKRLERMNPDAVLAVGSGVVNDLSKWASYELSIPYAVIATAASMNGYAAANVAPMIDGVKMLARAAAPKAVLAIPEVIEQAPFEMTAAGFGDTIAKFQSNLDWQINHFLFDEYFCRFSSHLIDDLVSGFLKDPESIQRRDPKAVRSLFESLFWSGVTMTLVGTSAPASGGEHLLSHTLDMASHVRSQTHDLHGRQVGLGVIFSAALYERIMQIDKPNFVELPDSIDADYWKADTLITAIREQYEAKKPAFQTAASKLSDPAAWHRLLDNLRPQVKSPSQCKTWLKNAGAAHRIKDIGFSRPEVLDAVLHMHQIRKRFTIVDLAWRLGILPDAAEEIIDQYLIE